jgi:REP element-mobilizing transposase RayT
LTYEHGELQTCTHTGGTFFFTVALRDRSRDTLVEHVDDLRPAFRDANAKSPWRTDAMVVLPGHLHVLWTLPEGDTDYSGRWRAIQSNFVPRLRLSDSTIGRNASGLHGALRFVYGAPENPFKTSTLVPEMEKLAARLSCLLLMVLMAACSRQPPRVFPPCLTSQITATLPVVEQQALAHSKKKQARSCSRPGVQCYFKVSTNPSNQIIVGTQFAFQNPADGRCLYSAGGTTDVYTADGAFVHSIMTL